MRRLVVEWSINDSIKQIKEQEIEKNKKAGANSNPDLIKKFQSTELDRLETINKIKSLEILHILRSNSSEAAAILRIETKDESLNAEELLKTLLSNVKVEYQLLEQDNGACIYFIKGRTSSAKSRGNRWKRNVPHLAI